MGQTFISLKELSLFCRITKLYYSMLEICRMKMIRALDSFSQTEFKGNYLSSGKGLIGPSILSLESLLTNMAVNRFFASR